MIYGPVKWDSNEWFVLGYLFVITLVMYFLPKRFPSSMTIQMLVFAAAVARIIDHLFAGPSFVDRYDVMDINKIEYFDILTYVFYGPSGYVLLYLYDKLQPHGLYISLFLVGGALAATAIEGVATLMHVFTYKQWHLYYSFPTYLAVQALTLWFFRFLKNEHHAVRPSPL